MIFRRLQNQPKLAIPVAIALIIAGLCSLLIGLAWPTFSSLAPDAGEGKSDFWHGFVIGLGIALEFGGAVIAIAATRRLRQPR